jgi:hypothetical protein
MVIGFTTTNAISVIDTPLCDKVCQKPNNLKRIWEQENQGTLNSLAKIT